MDSDFGLTINGSAKRVIRRLGALFFFHGMFTINGSAKRAIMCLGAFFHFICSLLMECFLWVARRESELDCLVVFVRREDTREYETPALDWWPVHHRIETQFLKIEYPGRVYLDLLSISNWTIGCLPFSGDIEILWSNDRNFGLPLAYLTRLALSTVGINLNVKVEPKSKQLFRGIKFCK